MNQHVSRRTFFETTAYVTATVAGIAASVPARAGATSKLPALEAAFFAEWNKLRALEPEHGAAERRYFDERVKLQKPVLRERTREEIEAVRNMTVAELGDMSRSLPGAMAALEFDDALRTYNRAEWKVRCSTGFTRVNRAYQRQHARATAAANRVIRSPAHSFDDLAAKARVHKTWEYADEADIGYIMADIARMAKKGVRDDRAQLGASSVA
ncbi:hypothetical protein [Mesorhizobium sp. BR1-1-4]|uniref:hypothetical protein n=1 Tax=Mesorhizobium sp. BR1-1-4 TaxID=2876650 RepID=UPI001CD01547|nr:hypothetical protein [Mesorhizobium sp. BR1-1-4]MBZ9926767.1 hypothetical protein [Mesorhizobium sp. BR1-1-4]